MIAMKFLRRSLIFGVKQHGDTSTAVRISLLSCKQAEIWLCHIDFRLMAAIFDFSLIQTSDSLRSSLVLLSDPENMVIAVEISLLSCIAAEIYVMSYLLPVNCRHR